MTTKQKASVPKIFERSLKIVFNILGGFRNSQKMCHFRTITNVSEHLILCESGYWSVEATNSF